MMKKLTVLLMALIIAACWMTTAMAVDAVVHYDMSAIPKSTEDIPQPPVKGRELPKPVDIAEKGDGVFAITFDQELEEKARELGLEGAEISISLGCSTAHGFEELSYKPSELTHEGKTYECHVPADGIIEYVSTMLALPMKDGVMNVSVTADVSDNSRIDGFYSYFARYHLDDGTRYAYTLDGDGSIRQFFVYPPTHDESSLVFNFDQNTGKLEEYDVYVRVPGFSGWLDYTENGTLKSANFFDNASGEHRVFWDMTNGWSGDSLDTFPEEYLDLSVFQVVTSSSLLPSQDDISASAGDADMGADPGVSTAETEERYTDEERMALIVGAFQSGISFSGPEDDSAFSMQIVVDEASGYSLLASGNKGVPNSVSSITATFHAEAGQVLEQNYRASSEFGYDELIVTLNGEVIKRLSGQTEWTKAAYVIPETGDYTAELKYVKDDSYNDGEDCVWINTFRLVSAEEGKAVLESLPPYMYSEEAGLSVFSDGAREFVLDEMMNLQLAYGGNVKCYVISTENVEIQAHITRDMDPDNACFMLNSTNEYIRLLPYAYQDGFFFGLNKIDTLETTGRSSTVIRLFPAVGESQVQTILLFAGEKGVEEYVRSSYSNPSRVKWRYTDEEEWRTVSEEVFVAPNLDGRSSAMYRFSAYSMSGSILVGVKIEMVSETDTYELTTNMSGGILAELPAAEYHVRVTNLGDKDTATCAPDLLGPEGGSCLIFITEGE